MLPFLKLKQTPVAGLIIKKRKPDYSEGGSVDEQNEQAADKDSGLETCAYAAIQAVKMDDTKAFVNAIRDMFTILDAQPHEEGDHTNPPSELNTYKYQNVKAAGDR